MIGWLKKCWRRFRYVVHIDGDPYLVRYRLIATPWFKIYLHHILRSDRDRELHDHPWDFWIFILWGGYWEVREGMEERYRMFSLRRKKATDLHRVILRVKSWLVDYELPPMARQERQNTWMLVRKFRDIKCWTLVFVGRKTREWGFQTDQGWVTWQEFHKTKGYDSDGNTRTDQEPGSPERPGEDAVGTPAEGGRVHAGSETACLDGRPVDPQTGSEGAAGTPDAGRSPGDHQRYGCGGVLPVRGIPGHDEG